MQIAQIEALVAIAREGSLRRAAERMGRSQPSLTKALRALEAEMNVALFHRSPRGVRLTRDGERVHARAMTILAELRRLRDEVAQMGGQGGGLVRVAVSHAAGTSILPQALRRFRRDWPRVEVEALDVLYPQSIALLRDGAVDAAIGPMPVPDPRGPVAVDPLYEMESLVVTRAGHPLAGAASLGDLAGTAWVALGPPEGPSGLLGGAFRDAGLPEPAALTRCHALNTMLAVIVETDAFGVLSRPLFEHVARAQGLVEVPVSEPLPRYRLSLATLKDRPLTPAASDLVRALRRRAGTLARREPSAPGA